MDFKNVLGKKCIVRSVNAGVFYGTIAEIDDSTVKLNNARCLWYWSGAASLNQLAVDGVKNPNSCKFTMLVDEIVIFGVCEILKTTKTAEKIIEGVEPWTV